MYIYSIYHARAAFAVALRLWNPNCVPIDFLPIATGSGHPTLLSTTLVLVDDTGRQRVETHKILAVHGASLPRLLPHRGAQLGKAHGFYILAVCELFATYYSGAIGDCLGTFGFDVALSAS